MPIKFEWNGPQVSQALRAGAVRGIGVAVEHLKGESLKVVPLRDGILAASAATDVDPITLSGSVSYDTPYAARQHEELDWRHAPGRTAKYLERPLHEQSDTMHRLIAEEIAKETQ